MESLVIVNVRNTSMKGGSRKGEGHGIVSKLAIRSDRNEVAARAVRRFGRRAAVTEISRCRSYQGRISGADHMMFRIGCDVGCGEIEGKAMGEFSRSRAWRKIVTVKCMGVE